jgi:hypothetical protein
MAIQKKKVRAGIVRAPSEMVRSLIYDNFFEDEAAAAAAALGDVGVVVGRVEEGAEGEEAEEEDTLQGRDVYWWTLLTNSTLLTLY